MHVPLNPEAVLDAMETLGALMKEEESVLVRAILGHFFFVVDPDAFMGRETFKKTAGDICRALRASQKAPGYDRIYTAGEKEYLTWLDRKDKGVPVGKAVQDELTTLRDKLNLPYKFSFE